MSFWEGNESILESLCEECIKSSDVRMNQLYDWLIWPIKAKRESYELLTSYSPMKLPSIGANRLLKNINKEYAEARREIEFELTANSNAIHIATALQATYFPFAISEEKGIYSDAFASDVLGSILNAYQYLYDKQQQSIGEYSAMLEKERKGIYLLKSDNSVCLRNVLDYADKYRTPTTLKRMLGELSKLDAKQQSEKISEYNNLIAEIGKEKFGGESVLNYVLGGAGLFPGVGTASSIVSIILQLLKDFGVKGKVVIKKTEQEKASTADEVYLLDKLSRVAKISMQ